MTQPDPPPGPPPAGPVGPPVEQPYAFTPAQAYARTVPPEPARAPKRPFLARWAPAQDLRAGAVVVGVLAAVGALLGVVWQWWSPPGPLGFVVAAGAIQPDETEAFVAADGRFAVLCGAVGLVAGFVVWRRRGLRGPVAVLSLALGGLVGALLTLGVGHLLAGGSAEGAPNTLLRELPLTVHMRGLLLLEAGLAVLVYIVLASFAAADDLGRPDPDRPQDALHPQPVPVTPAGTDPATGRPG